MKFIKEEETTKKTDDGNISITIGQQNTSLQAKVIAMSANQTLDGQVAQLNYILANSATKVVINGKEYKPMDLVGKPDLRDQDTLKIMVILLGLSLDAIALSDEEVKNSSGQVSQSEAESNAGSAPKVEEDDQAPTAECSSQ
ncbi:MAG: hypothetical protein KAV87_26025 [Desulfobacteraceae bacterium]|nr:hypothetical protein [Desulfobacteraceae bacterium]